MKINLQDWHKHFNRPLPLHQAQIYSWSCSDPLKRILGKGIYNQIYVIKSDNADGYFLKKEWKDFNNYILNNRFNNRNFLNNSNDATLKGALVIENYFNTFSKIELSELNDQALLKLFKKTIKFLNIHIAPLWVGFILQDIIEKTLIDVLEKNRLDVKSGLEIIGSAEKPNHIIQEQLALMKIALTNKKTQERALKKHYLKYNYIPCYSTEITPYSLSYFNNRLKKITKKQAQKFIDNTEQGFKDNSKKYTDFIKGASLSLMDKLFIEYAHEYIFLKDYRSHFRSLAMLNHGRLLKEIARRHDLSSEEISLLRHQEIIELFIHPLKIKNIIKRRKKRTWAYIFKNGQDFVVIKDDIIEKKVKRETVIKGQPASPGIVSGVVKIVLSPNSVNKVKKGNILVSAMTRPDYIVAIKNAAAIITDEGGLLCHAAIVSREMGKACIIGTKNATKYLKDGDKIKVDANKGIITILK